MPYFPPASTIFPPGLFDSLAQQTGMKLGWLKSHTCPCTGSSASAGTANASCLTCFGRGVYWDSPALPFVGFLTFSATGGADEPGMETDAHVGQVFMQQPILTIVQNGGAQYPLNGVVYSQAGTFDAFCQYDAKRRMNTTLVVGRSNVIPYPTDMTVYRVTTWNPVTQQAEELSPSQYQCDGNTVTVTGSPARGMAYTVEYSAAPIFVAYRPVGGAGHKRPVGFDSVALPVRFHLQELDLWSRQRFSGDGPRGLNFE